MRALLAVAVLAAACGGAADPADLPMARLAGEVCRVPLLAGAVVIDNGLVLSVAHVVAGAEDAIVVRLPDGGEAPGRLVGFDPERDLALLAVDGLGGERIEFGSPQPGDTVRIAAISREDAVVSVPGEVLREITATGEDIYGEGDVSRRALELAADIAPGMSGAGVYGDDGALLGVVFAESRQRQITYAVTSGEVEAFLAGVDPSTEVDSGRC